MTSLEVTRKAEEDVADVLSYTRARWGEGKYWEYADLIEEAYLTITVDPARGEPRSNIANGVLCHHIRRPGRNARHVVFYAYDPAKDRVTVLRVLHDSMDFVRHLP